MPKNKHRKLNRNQRRAGWRDVIGLKPHALVKAPPEWKIEPVLADANPVGTALELSGVAVIGQAVEAADGKPKKLPTIQVDAYNGGAMRVAGYYRPVVIDLAGVSGAGRAIPVLRNHDFERIVGHGVAAIEGAQIKLAGTLSAENDDAGEITRMAANGFPWQASVGLQPTRLENVEAGAAVRVNGNEVQGPAVVVRAGKLYEVSIVPLGADDSTATHVAAMGDAMGFEAWVKAKGWNPETLTDEQKTILRAQYDASGFGAGSGAGGQSAVGGGAGGNAGGNGGGAGGAGGTVTAGRAPSTVEAALAVGRAREQREAEYSRIIAGAIDRGMSSSEAELLVRAAVEAQTNPTQFELDVLRAEREVGSGQAPYGFSRKRGQETTAEVIECALAQTGNVVAYDHINADGTRTQKQLYSDDLQQRARDRFPQGLTLMEAMVMAARRSGYVPDTFRLSKQLMQAAFAPVMARGASTYDLSGVLSNVANKSIMAGFNSVENSWREVSAIGTVTDFKEITHYALTGDFVYEQVGKGGELKHATMGEQAYANKADTYGKIFAITRQDFINDDLSAFSRVRTMLGRGAALKLNLVFWTEFLDAVTTFFTTARGNYQEGAGTVLDIDSLTAAELLFMNQTDPDGNPLGLEPAILLTPNALANQAVRLTRDSEIRIDGASSKTTYTTANPHAGKYRPVRSSYLNNANVPNGSATHWFLTASPMDLPLIETVFLNGQQQPLIDAAEADFDQLGVQMRGYHDFGARKQEYRAGVRSKGAAA